MRKYFLIFLLLTPYLTYTQGSSKGVSSLKLPLTPIVAGSGESFIAYPTNIQSIRINPANVASLESYGLLFSHSEWILDTQTEYLSVVAPFQYGSLAFSISSTNVNNIEIRDIPGEPIGTFDFSSSAFQLNYGVEINNFLKIGIASKYFYEKNYIDDSSGFGFDAGLHYYT
ncbi:MAG: hypothetical protein N3A61_08505, partial [Ignavibacteria bacterium]|nr:hypothetical protein [Ignavibacteria bacterium]